MFLAYDISRENTFENALKWLKEVRQNSGSDVIVFLVGTQVDKEDKRAVSEADAIAFMEQNHLDYFIETSAKTNHNIEKLFTAAAQKLYVKYKAKIENMLDESEGKISKHSSKSNKIVLERETDNSQYMKKKKGC